MITKESDGSLTFRTLVNGKAESASEKNYILLTNKSGGYTIEATAKIGDKTVTVSTFINVKNDTQMPKKDESYEINKINATDEMPYYNIISQAVADKTAPTGKAAHTLDSTIVANTGRVLALHATKAVAAPDNGQNVDALKASQVYIDTAALPSFRLNGDNAVVWVVADRLNQEVKNADAGVVIKDFKNKTTVATPNSAVFGTIDEFEGDVNIVSLPAVAGASPMLNKIYMKSDASMADKKATFDDPKVEGGKLKVKLQNTTPAGVYVAEVKYTLKGKDYFARVEFSIMKAEITALAVKVDGIAPAAAGAVNGIVAANVTKDSATPVAADIMVKSIAYYNMKTGTATAVESTATWTAGDIPQYVITVAPSTANYMFKSGLAVTLAAGGTGATSADYTVVSSVMNTDGDLVITIKKNAAIA